MARRYLRGEERLAQRLSVAPRQRRQLAQALQTVEIAEARGLEPRRESRRMRLVMVADSPELTDLSFYQRRRLQPLRRFELSEERGLSEYL